jgi:hypothetical protein
VITKNAARTAALIAVPTPSKPDVAKEASNGWDPYEVWRTRVLMPRLEPRVIPADRPTAVSSRIKR